MSRWRRVLIVLLTVLLVFLIARAGVDIWAARRISTEIARLESKHGSLDVNALVVPSVPDTDNRARPMRAAAALIGGRYEAQQSISRFTGLKLPAPVPGDLRAFVASNQEAVRVAGEARARRQANWEADYLNGNLPSLMEVRSLSDAIYLAARIELDEGRVDQAVERITTGLALSASLRQEPSLIVQLIRITVGARQLEAVQRAITAFEPTPASLESLAQWLSENRKPDPMHLGLLSELKYFNSAMARVEAGLAVAPEAAANFIPRAVVHSRLARPLLRLSRLRYLEQMGILLDLHTGPRPRSAVPNHASWWSPLKRLQGIAGPGLERAMDTSDVFNNQLTLTELAVALRRFRIDRGRYPDSLDALVPAYVTVVPVDSVTGTPPGYSRQGTGFRLSAGKGSRTPAQMTPTLEWVVPK